MASFTMGHSTDTVYSLSLIVICQMPLYPATRKLRQAREGFMFHLLRNLEYLERHLGNIS